MGSSIDLIKTEIYNVFQKLFEETNFTTNYVPQKNDH